MTAIANLSDKGLCPYDLTVVWDLIYNPCKFETSDLSMEQEGLEYGACSFKLNSLFVKFRIAKITPKKIGQFVTLWKRIGDGAIQPYDIKDDVDFVIITTRSVDGFGQFIFPTAILCKHGIMSNNGNCGKLGIRVYPPWDITISYQAKKTQAWQLQYFLEIREDKPIDYALAKKLYNLIDIIL